MLSQATIWDFLQLRNRFRSTSHSAAEPTHSPPHIREIWDKEISCLSVPRWRMRDTRQTCVQKSSMSPFLFAFWKTTERLQNASSLGRAQCKILCQKEYTREHKGHMFMHFPPTNIRALQVGLCNTYLCSSSGSSCWYWCLKYTLPPWQSTVPVTARAYLVLCGCILLPLLCRTGLPPCLAATAALWTWRIISLDSVTLRCYLLPVPLQILVLWKKHQTCHLLRRFKREVMLIAALL